MQLNVALKHKMMTVKVSTKADSNRFQAANVKSSESNIVLPMLQTTVDHKQIYGLMEKTKKLIQLEYRKMFYWKDQCQKCQK